MRFGSQIFCGTHGGTNMQSNQPGSNPNRSGQQDPKQQPNKPELGQKSPGQRQGLPDEELNERSRREGGLGQGRDIGGQNIGQRREGPQQPGGLGSPQQDVQRRDQNKGR
jgi:hypothetical protein